MEIDTNKYRIERGPDAVTFTDLTASVYTPNTAYWAEGEGRENIMIIPFAPEPTAAEQWAVTRRLITESAQEEALYAAAEDAVRDSKAWREGAGLALYNQANTLAGSATATAADVRKAFSGIASTLVQMDKVCSRQEVVIPLLLKLMNQSSARGLPSA